MPELQVDRAQIARFLDAMCRYAEPGTYLSVRAFYDDESKLFFSQGCRLGDDPAELLPAIEELASRCTRPARPIVFAPPLATFIGPEKATEEALANGLALSVECDSHPEAARLKLEALLGPPTVVVASGGEWTDPETGEVQNKLHLHWRLNEPTKAAEDHHRLKRARTLATRLVGGDASNKPIVHPIRWPGSWHRKSKPRLARIVDLTEAELDLGDALDLLQDAIGGVGPEAEEPEQESAGEGEERDTAELIRAVLRAEDYHGPLTALAMRFLRAGMPDPQAVLTLRGVMLAIPEADRDKKDGTPQHGRWQARYDDIPRAVSTARAKCGEAETRQTEPKGNWGQPIDFFSDPNGHAPELRAHHLPEALFPLVADTAERMGVDRTTVALSCIVSCASVISDDWCIQPKRYDYTWTESPRLWGAIVGDPSILKSPVISACTKPIDKLDADARRRHREAMRQYKQKLKEAKADKTGLAPEPVYPRLDRYLIEGATIEAISEVLRDDDEATQRAPAGKVLSRHDEMSEFFGNLDRYKVGGKGGGDRGAYLRLFNGGPYTIDRIMRGSFSVPNWSACFLGGIQPGPIQKIAKDSAEDGLLQRFLYVVPGPPKPGLDRAPDRQAGARYAALFPALTALHPARTPQGDHVQTVAFHADAHQHREDVEAMARAMAFMPDTSPRLKAAFGKWPGIFARIALTFHLVEIADTRARNEVRATTMIISEQTADRAASFMLEIVLPHLLRADALMFSTAQTNHAERIAGWILIHGLSRVSARDVVRNYKPFASPESRAEMAAVMERLTLVNWLEPELPSNPMKPVHAWTVNPAVHERFSGYAEREKRRREEAREAIHQAKQSAGRRHAGDAEEPAV